ncbi:uncharacterized protein LOC113211353 [Frankliniella occidentalis]|uniref:Uncharacterized protein LOC113211353 n=1 Tax=Frankliniella occidentalis TaxID=133901 RepID=A0A6J1T1N0_FRAOC|nr:uncharacterized protein LOC113211353 [Frankliniella occidentalis]
MARIALLLLTAGVALLVAADLVSFDLAEFRARFQKGTPYIDSACAHMEPFVSKINALEAVQRDRLAVCLYEAALNALDQDSTEKEMFEEIGGCLFVWSDTATETYNLYNEILAIFETATSKKSA